MNEKITNTLLVVLITLLLSACGGLETAPESADTPAPPAMVSPTSVPTATTNGEVPAENPSQYIGLVYPPSHTGLTQVFSMLIQNKEDHSLMMVVDGGNKMLWLNRIDHYDENGGAFWEVKDVLGLSDLESGLTLIPDGCSLNGVPDSEIIAAGRNGVIVLAWRADTTLGKFESIPVNGIQCNSDKTMPLE